MTDSQGLAPVVGDNARLLILGSLPSVRSIALQQYYAFPTNKFWQIMEDLFEVRADLEYSDRLQGLKQSGVALWDTLASAARKGSLDANIDAATARPNDFAAFFEKHSEIRVIAFNGGNSKKFFDRLVIGANNVTLARVEYLLMPSTSAANTTMKYHKKLEKWSAIKNYRPAF